MPSNSKLVSPSMKDVSAVFDPFSFPLFIVVIGISSSDGVGVELLHKRYA